jgi:Icc-related predicted phosphoesterase
MRILHTSDLHLNADRFDDLVQRLVQDDYDIWLDSGDLLPDVPLSATGRDTQADWQLEWLRQTDFRARVREALGSRDAYFAPGNHDAIRIGPIMYRDEKPTWLAVNTRGFVSPNISHSTVYGNHCGNTMEGLVPYLTGLLAFPVVLTHMPPRNCLQAQDEHGDWGCPGLAQAIRNARPTRCPAILCGHAHDPIKRVHNGLHQHVHIYNSATQANVLELDVC